MDDIRAIIFGAPSLEQIENVNCKVYSLMSAIWHTDKVKLVASMTLPDGICRSACDLLVVNPPGLKTLEISDITGIKSSPTTLVAMKAVLFASQDTLKKLSFRNASVPLDDMPTHPDLLPYFPIDTTLG